MITRDILNLIFGSVSFSAENGFCERFINSCNAKNIPLWDIKKNGSKITAKTTPSGYLKIRQPAKESSMKVQLVKKTGLPFLLNRYIHRTGLVAGFIFAAVLLVFLSGRIWIIEVTGNETLTDEEVIEAFEDAGLTIGVSKKKLEIPKIESSAMLELHNASWAAINIRGCVAEINVRDLEKIPEIETHSGTSNIVALKDGQIAVLEVYRGSAVAEIGQAVLEGEPIISGVTQSRLDTTLFTDAYGYIVAKTNIKVQTKTDNRIIECSPEHKKVWSLFFSGVEVFPHKKDKGEYYEHRSRLKINGKTLPFGLNYRLYTTFEEKEKTISKEMTELMALTDYSLECYYKTGHTKIISQDIDIAFEDDCFTITGNCFCYENIGKTVSFETEETEESPE